MKSQWIILESTNDDGAPKFRAQRRRGDLCGPWVATRGEAEADREAWREKQKNQHSTR